MKTLSRRRGRGPIAAVIAAAGALVLSACTSVTYAETPLPRPRCRRRRLRPRPRPR